MHRKTLRRFRRFRTPGKETAERFLNVMPNLLRAVTQSTPPHPKKIHLMQVCPLPSQNREENRRGKAGWREEKKCIRTTVASQRCLTGLTTRNQGTVLNCISPSAAWSCVGCCISRLAVMMTSSPAVSSLLKAPWQSKHQREGEGLRGAERWWLYVMLRSPSSSRELWFEPCRFVGLSPFCWFYLQMFPHGARMDN